jgi:hypothetical protein
MREERERPMKYEKKDFIACENLIRIAQLLKDNGYQVHGIEFGVPRELDGEIGLYFTVNVSKYVTLDSDYNGDR